MEEVRLLLVIVVRTVSGTLHIVIPVPVLCEHRVSERADLRNHRPQSYTCMGVWAIRFLGSVLATARFVRSTNVDQVPRRRRRSASTAYDYVERIHEMSRVNRATGALNIGSSAGYTLFFIFMHILLLFTTYVSSDTHIHIHVITYITLVF